MIVQACINGARASDFHPALPLFADTMASDGAACVAAGAAELHLHPRNLDGCESLAPATMDATMHAMRRACPGTLIGVSTGAWIEGDERRTLACIDGWTELPDYASVNLEEPDAPAVMERLRQRGIGIEPGWHPSLTPSGWWRWTEPSAVCGSWSRKASRTPARQWPLPAASGRCWTVPGCGGPCSCTALMRRFGAS